MLRGIHYRFNQLNQRIAFAARGFKHFSKLSQQSDGKRQQVAAVMVGRNDDYMPDFSHRLQATIAWNTRHLIDEVIFIEWNPPPERELLAPTLTEKFANVRVYVVPQEIHQRLCENSRLPLMEYHAKNVGIRRAKSPWIIATNADVAIGADTIQNFARMPLANDVAWTAQRIDISWTEWRQKEIGLIDCLRYRRIIPYSEHGTGDFLLASRDLWHRVSGYDENLLKHRIGCDIRGAAQLLAHGAKIQRIGNVMHLAHPTSCTEQVQAHHGEYAPLDNLPYQNDEAWGLGNCKEVEIAERVWRLE
jgi:hypothetical protein